MASSTLVCRTCLYVSESALSFKKLDKVKSVLEIFIPEMKNCLEKSSQICEQCYYFLKNVEKFKAKCLDTQQKLYSMNIDSIRQERESVIMKSSINNAFKRRSTLHTARPLEAKKLKRFKQKPETTKKVLHHHEEYRVRMDVVENFKCLHTTVEFDDDNKHFKNEDETQSVFEEEGSYMEDKSTEKDQSSSSPSPIEIIEVTSDEDDNVNPTEHTGKVEFRMRKSLDDDKKSKDADEVKKVISNNVKVKTEIDDNPGFFNKKATNGFYKCKLCIKRYKTSKGLYNHTKISHKDEAKFYHCQYCSFFTLWRSALTKHSKAYHENTIRHSVCPHCKFESRSPDQLNRHILENHVFETFTSCTLCRARFTHKTAFMEHIKNEHVNAGLPGTMKCSHFCSECSILFLTLMDYRIHLAEFHKLGLVVCDKCTVVCNSKEEYFEHKKRVHDDGAFRGVGDEVLVGQSSVEA